MSRIKSIRANKEMLVTPAQIKELESHIEAFKNEGKAEAVEGVPHRSTIAFQYTHVLEQIDKPSTVEALSDRLIEAAGRVREYMEWFEDTQAKEKVGKSHTALRKNFDDALTPKIGQVR